MVFFSFVVLGPDRFDPSYFYLTALTGYPPQFSTLHLTPMSLYGIYHIISRNKDFLDKDNCQCQGQAALALLQIIITLLRYIGCIFTLLKLYASKKKIIYVTTISPYSMYFLMREQQRDTFIVKCFSLMKVGMGCNIFCYSYVFSSHYDFNFLLPQRNV